MDPISAVSLAGTALEFLEFGVKMVTLAQEIKTSSEGNTLANAQLEENAGALDVFCTKLSKYKNVDSSMLDEDDRAIMQLCSKCASQAQDIRGLLSQLKGPKDTNFCIHLVRAVKVQWKDTDLREMERSLEKSTRDLQLHLTAAVYRKQRSVYDETKAVDVHTTGSRRPNHIQMQARQDLLDRSIAIEDALVSRQHAFSSTSHGAFIERLYYPGMRKRYDAIQTAHNHTFDWMFRNEHQERPLGFLRWLRAGSGIFWVTGKAGCGKSTLMKYICSDPRTERELAIWSGSRPTVLAKYFFWIGGTTLETSQAGLVKTLLFEILSQENALLGEYARDHPVRFQEILHGTASTQQLTHLLTAIKSSSGIQNSFCFFIDGLDEFDGKPRDICDFLIGLASTVNVKLCVSSRPWNEFESTFGGDASKVIRVHEHTKGDIEMYINDLVVKDNAFEQMRDMDERYSLVINKIVDSAQGVFLWVYLVVLELQSKLPNLDSAEDFEEAVDTFPRDLDSYFARMIEAISDNHKSRAARALLIILHAFAEVRLVQLVPLFVDVPEVSSQQKISIPIAELRSLLDVTRTRLKAHCKDLVEVRLTHDTATLCECNQLHVEYAGFLHRTVIDFLDQPNTRAILTEHAGRAFDPHLALGRCKLYEMDSLPWLCPHSDVQEDFEINGGMTFPHSGWPLAHTPNEIVLDLAFHAIVADKNSRNDFVALFDKVEQNMESAFTRKSLFESEHICPDSLLSANLLQAFDFPMSLSGRLDDEQSRELAVELFGGCFAFVTAARLGITWYVSERLSRTGSTTSLSPPIPARILKHVAYAACCKGTTISQTTDGKVTSRSDSAQVDRAWLIHLPILRLLFEAGACQPNEVLICGRSLFHGLLQKAIDYQQSSQYDITAQAKGAFPDAFRMLIAHGAEFPHDPEKDPKLADIEWAIHGMCSEHDAKDLIRLMQERIKAQRKGSKSKRETLSRVRKGLHLRL